MKIDDQLKFSLIQYLTDQNIDIFNKTHDFYTDICFHFDSPIDKDIALKDRISIFYPNVTLCENGCAIKGVNLTSMRAKCECKLNNLINNNILSNNAWYQSQMAQIQELISETNIIIITCIKEFFKFKYPISSIGFYIVMSIIAFQIVVTIIFCTRSLNPIKKYIFDIIDKYIFYLTGQKNEIKMNEPPKKKRKSHKIRSKSKFQFEINTNNTNKKKYNVNLNSILENKNKIMKTKDSNKNNQYNNNIFVINNIGNSNDRIKLSPNFDRDSLKNKLYETKNNDNYLNFKYDLNSDMKNYLETEFEDMTFEDLLERDKRELCLYFLEKLKTNLIIINTFSTKEPLRPMTIKILLFILDIDLYLFVNALFINEDFEIEIFHSIKDENIFSFLTHLI